MTEEELLDYFERQYFDGSSLDELITYLQNDSLPPLRHFLLGKIYSDELSVHGGYLNFEKAEACYIRCASSVKLSTGFVQSTLELVYINLYKKIKESSSEKAEEYLETINPSGLLELQLYHPYALYYFYKGEILNLKNELSDARRSYRLSFKYGNYVALFGEASIYMKESKFWGIIFHMRAVLYKCIYKYMISPLKSDDGIGLWVRT